jgi:hypothetical protein
MKFLIHILLLLSLSANSQTVHTFIGTGSTEVRIMQPGYQDSNLYETYFATPYAIAPGDRVEFQGVFARVDMYGYRGTNGNRITITYGDSVAWIKRGLRGYDLSDILIIGADEDRTSADSTGSREYPLRFGYIGERDAGLDLLGRMKNITIKNIRFDDGHYAVRLKTDVPEDEFHGFCDSSYTHIPGRPNNHIIDSILIEGCYSRNQMGDPLYIGNTNPFSLVSGVPTTYTMCPSGEGTFTPMRMGNVVIRYNAIVISGRTPIQLSGAEFGVNKIYNNYIANCGDELNQSQGFGIAIGGATKNCYVYHNRIKKTFQYGIFDIGAGTNYLFNNELDSIGYIDRYIESGAFNLQFPFRDRDSTIVAETSNFEIVGGDKVKNISGNLMVSILSKPGSVTGYVKNVHIYNNSIGLTTGIMTDGSIAFRQDDGLNANWGTNNFICNNTNRIGGAPHVWTYVSGEVTYATYSTNCVGYRFPFQRKWLRFRF